MMQFEIGKTYTMRSICDHDCVWEYTVTKRTAQTVTITDGKNTQTCRISKRVSEYRGAETIYPLGQYSMSPSLTADNERIAKVPAVVVTDYTISADLLAFGFIGSISGRLSNKQNDFLMAVVDNAKGVIDCR